MKNNMQIGYNEVNIKSYVAYKEIKLRLLQNKLDFRKKLNEKQFAEELNLSRTPIREAFIMLEKENLLNRDDTGSFRIKQFTIKQIQDLYQFREILEIASVNSILSNITDEMINQLFEILEEMHIIIKDRDPGSALVKGLDFHIKFNELSRNSMIIESLKSCYDRLTLVSWGLQKTEMSIKSWKEHKKILSALKLRDQNKLKMLISEHISSGKERILTILKEDEEKIYFFPARS